MISMGRGAGEGALATALNVPVRFIFYLVQDAGIFSPFV